MIRHNLTKVANLLIGKMECEANKIYNNIRVISLDDNYLIDEMYDNERINVVLKDNIIVGILGIY